MPCWDSTIHHTERAPSSKRSMLSRVRLILPTDNSALTKNNVLCHQYAAEGDDVSMAHIGSDRSMNNSLHVVHDTGTPGKQGLTWMLGTSDLSRVSFRIPDAHDRDHCSGDRHMSCSSLEQNRRSHKPLQPLFPLFLERPFNPRRDT